MSQEKIINNILEALSRHESSSAVDVLERIGTNSSDDEVRMMTAKALIKRNTPDSLSIVIGKPGKGINDLSTNVAMSTINELLSLKDKTEAMKILDEVKEKHSDQTIKETARSVKALMLFS